MTANAKAGPEGLSPSGESEYPRELISQAVDDYQRSLLAYASGLLRDSSASSEAAQDAVQETFLQLCRKVRDLARCDGPPTLAEFTERLAPWLFTVCRTQVIDMQRKHQPRSFASSDDPAPEVAILDPRPTPVDAALASEEHRRVADSINDLTARQREVLQLRMQAGLSYREIAEVTGLTTTNVGFHLHQAVASLRKQLAAT